MKQYKDENHSISLKKKKKLVNELPKFIVINIDYTNFVLYICSLKLHIHCNYQTHRNKAFQPKGKQNQAKKITPRKKGSN